MAEEQLICMDCNQPIEGEAVYPSRVNGPVHKGPCPGEEDEDVSFEGPEKPSDTAY